MKDVIRATVLAAAAALLAGCGKSEERATDTSAAPGDTPGEEAAAAPDQSRKVCELESTAPAAHQWTTWWDTERVQYSGQNDSWASSIHWADAEGERALANNPKALSITCKSDDAPAVIVSLQSFGSTKADIPASSGTYPIVPRSTDGKVKPGTFIAGVLSLDNAMFEATGGTVQVDRLDMNGVAGSFTVDGAEHPAMGTRTIHLEGTFDIPCIGDQLERLCTAPERRRQ
jgi:hypothetical protein